MPEKVFECGSCGRIRVWRMSNRVTMLRVEDRCTRFFEGLWEIPEGITYNSYLVFGEEAIALLDTVKAGFADCYVEALKSVVDPADIGYIVVHHSEPDHSGALPRILSEAREATVYSHPIARRFVEATYGVKLEKHVAVRDGATLDLGGAKLSFTTTPWLHWPDTVMSFLDGEGVLFSGDVFGAYGVPEDFTDKGLGFDEYVRLMRKYLATVVGTYRNWIPKGLAKLEPIRSALRVIAPLHGLVVVENVDRILSLYAGWGEGRLDERRAVVVYFSMYGSTARAAEEAARLLEGMGFNVNMYGFTDTSRSAVADVVGEVFDARVLVFAAPTYEASVMPLAGYVAETLCKKAVTPRHRVLIVSPYGWGAAAARILANIFGKCRPEKLEVLEAAGRIEAGELKAKLEELLR